MPSWTGIIFMIPRNPPLIPPDNQGKLVRLPVHVVERLNRYLGKAEQLVQDAVRNRGEQRDVVERDLHLLAQLLNRLASLKAEIQIAPEHVEFTVRGGPTQ